MAAARGLVQQAGRPIEAEATLDEATRRHVGSSEVWMLLGQARLSIALADATAASEELGTSKITRDILNSGSATPGDMKSAFVARAGFVSKVEAAKVLDLS